MTTCDRIGGVHRRCQDTHPHLIGSNGRLRDIERQHHFRTAWLGESDDLH